MFVELGELPVYVIACGQSQTAAFECVVDEIPASVRQVAVGVCVTHVPVEPVVVKEMFCRELSVVCGAAAVIIFRAFFQVALSRYAAAVCVAVFAYLVEYVFQLEAVIVVDRHECEVEHGSHPVVVVVLVVGAFSQVVALVMGLVVCSVHGVFHVGEGLVRVAVVQSSEQGYLTSAFVFPESVHAYAERCVGHRLHLSHPPVVVQSVAEQVCSRSGYGSQFRSYASVQASQSVVKAQEVGAAAFVVEEVAEVCGIVDASAYRYRERVFRRDVFGVYEYESSAEVCRIFRCRRLYDHHVVELR